MDFRAPAFCAAGLALVTLAGGCAHPAGSAMMERVYLPSVAVNQHFVRAILDTGFGTTDLCEPSANQLGIKFTAPDPSLDRKLGTLAPELSEPLDFTVGPQVLRAQLPVIRVAWGTGREDVIVGWPEVRNNVLIFDGAHRTITVADVPPPETIGWQKFRILPTTGVNRTHGLCLLVPQPDGKNGVLLVDTGSDHGVALPPAQWKEWLAAHPAAPTTNRLYYNVYGAVTKPEAWAAQVNLGNLELTDVPLREADTVDEVTGTGFIGSLGLYALRRMDLVVDGVNNVAYLRPKPAPGPVYTYIPRPGVENNSALYERTDWTITGNLRVDVQPLAIFAAMLKCSNGDYDGALADFTHALDVDPTDADAYRYRGIIRMFKGADAAAIGDFSRALELDPTRAPLYRARGAAKLNTRDYRGAEADLTRYLAAVPQDVEAFVDRGSVRLNLRDFTGALTDFNQALALDPSHLVAYINRANTLSSEGDFEQAIVDYNRALKLDPKSALAYTNRGSAKVSLRDFDGALADLNAGLSLDPQNAEAYVSRGTARLHLRDFDNAVADLTLGIKLDPKNVAAYLNRATARGQLNDYAGEIADATDALALNPTSLAAYAARGAAHQARNELTDALADYDRALQLSPFDPNTRRLRGQALMASGEFSRAAADFASMLQSRPDALAERCLFTIALRRAGLDDARANLSSSLASAPPGWTRTIGHFLAGYLTEEEFLAEAAQGDEPTRSLHRCLVFYYLGMQRLIKGDPSTARGFFTQSLATGESACPEYALARAELARLRERPTTSTTSVAE